MTTTVMLHSNLPSLGTAQCGKVWDCYDVGEGRLHFATDRISAYDVNMAEGIPRKGEVLRDMTVYWLKKFDVPNHLITENPDEFPEECRPYRDQLAGRSIYVKKTEPLLVECVPRGYMYGSLWEDYKAGRQTCGILLPKGLIEAQELPEPIFTPATKAEHGAHDENITFGRMAEIVGLPAAQFMRRTSLELYSQARDWARRRGIIIADTKFEFGIWQGRVILIDEVLTPDSSRFWPAKTYEPGHSQPSFDKQYLRDYLRGLGWNRQPPPPTLPPEVIRQTSEKYVEALTWLCSPEAKN